MIERPSLLFVPVVVAAPVNLLSTVAGVPAVSFERYSAPPPPCGEAIDLPDIVVVPPPLRVERMLTPGAQMSTQAP